MLGGSFDPPHAGHVHISKEALKRFGLDEVWWLVSPGNPLKARGPAPFEKRMAAARALVDHPRISVSDFEKVHSTRYTAETLRKLFRKYPGVTFVWLSGADILTELHLWQDWRWIVSNIPLGVLARPGQRMSARMSRAARVYRDHRLKPAAARLLPQSAPPVWSFVNVPMVDVSSTRLRKEGKWPK